MKNHTTNFTNSIRRNSHNILLSFNYNDAKLVRNWSELEGHEHEPKLLAAGRS